MLLCLRQTSKLHNACVSVPGTRRCSTTELLAAWCVCVCTCRQLISRVLVALRPSWLAEPQLAAGVSSKLLNDLKQLLPAAVQPSPVAAAAPAAAPAGSGATQAAPDSLSGEQPDAVTAASADVPEQQPAQDEQGRPQIQQQQQQVQKMLALLSCFVAILKATCGTPGHQKLAGDAIDFLETAHERLCSLAAAAAAAGDWPDSTWASAAASLADSMLALWEALGSDQLTAASAAADSDGRAAATVADGRADASNDTEGSLGESAAAGTAHEAAASSAGVDVAIPAAGAAGATPALDVTAVSHRAWTLVLDTLQLQLLSAEDAVGLLSSVSGALTWALAVTGDSSADGHGLQEQQQHAQQQQQLQARTRAMHLVPHDLPMQLWQATQAHRYACACCMVKHCSVKNCSVVLGHPSYPRLWRRSGLHLRRSCPPAFA